MIATLTESGGLVRGELEHEIVREPLDVALHPLDETAGLDSVELGEVLASHCIRTRLRSHFAISKPLPCDAKADYRPSGFTSATKPGSERDGAR